MKMKPRSLSICLLTIGFLLLSAAVTAQTFSYSLTTQGTFSDGDDAPFSLVSNEYGKIPIDSNNGYLSAFAGLQSATHGRFKWDAGMEWVAAAPRYKNIYLQQIYVGVSYRSLTLSVGSRERYTSLWDRQLSSGDMVFSANARPIPEVNLSMPDFTVVPLTKRWMQVRGEVAWGKSFDKDYLSDFAGNLPQTYVNDVLWMHKSFYVRIKDMTNAAHPFPLSMIIGVQHWSQWGGTSTDPAFGKQPHGLSDMVRVFFGQSGGATSSLSDQINALGNHYGSYDFRLQYESEPFDLQLGYQHYFEDKSGMIFVNQLDGLWGLQLNLKKFSPLSKVVLEYMNTRDQSGPFHMLDYDHKRYPGHGGGNDNYYNNQEYTTGVSYFGRSIGSPLMISPEYNDNGQLGFLYNRFRNWHAGISGNITRDFSYRMLFTYMKTWGTYSAPLLDTQHAVSGVLDINYVPAKYPEWSFTASLAADRGKLLHDNMGVSLKISRCGVFSMKKSR